MLVRVLGSERPNLKNTFSVKVSSVVVTRDATPDRDVIKNLSVRKEPSPRLLKSVHEGWKFLGYGFFRRELLDKYVHGRVLQCV